MPALARIPDVGRFTPDFLAALDWALSSTTTSGRATPRSSAAPSRRAAWTSPKSRGQGAPLPEPAPPPASAPTPPAPPTPAAAPQPAFTPDPARLASLRARARPPAWPDRQRRREEGAERSHGLARLLPSRRNADHGGRFPPGVPRAVLGSRAAHGVAVGLNVGSDARGAHYRRAGAGAGKRAGVRSAIACRARDRARRLPRRNRQDRGQAVCGQGAHKGQADSSLPSSTTRRARAGSSPGRIALRVALIDPAGVLWKPQQRLAVTPRKALRRRLSPRHPARRHMLVLRDPDRPFLPVRTVRHPRWKSGSWSLPESARLSRSWSGVLDCRNSRRIIPRHLAATCSRCPARSRRMSASISSSGRGGV